jgi:hypothetical protein
VSSANTQVQQQPVPPLTRGPRRLANGPVFVFVFALEKRSYVKVLPFPPPSLTLPQAGPWTPEAAVEDP